MDGDWKRWAAENPEAAARQESEWARDAERKAAERDAETPEQHQTRLAKQNARRRRETPEQREARLAKAREYRQRCKAAETPERAEERKRRARERQRRRRAGMKSGEWQGREERERGRQVALARAATTAMVLAAQQRQARWEQGWGRFLNWRTLAVVAGVAVVGWLMLSARSRRRDGPGTDGGGSGLANPSFDLAGFGKPPCSVPSCFVWCWGVFWFAMKRNHGILPSC